MDEAFANIRDMSVPVVGIFVDYESPLARKVASDIWSGLSRAALDAGYARTTALWESLREPRSTGKSEEPRVHIFAIGQDRPDAIDSIEAVGDQVTAQLYGVVVAVPDEPSPLAGSLLYQGVGRLTDRGVKTGSVEPALLHAREIECERYAQKLLQRFEKSRK